MSEPIDLKIPSENLEKIWSLRHQLHDLGLSVTDADTMIATILYFEERATVRLAAELFHGTMSPVETPKSVTKRERNSDPTPAPMQPYEKAWFLRGVDNGWLLFNSMCRAHRIKHDNCRDCERGWWGLSVYGQK